MKNLIIVLFCLIGLFTISLAQTSQVGSLSANVVKIECTKMFPFSEGIAVLRNEGDSWCAINSEGRMVIPYNTFIANGEDYDNIGFKAGLLKINLRTGHVGFINKKGESVIKPIYASAGDFNDYDFTLALKPNIGSGLKRIRQAVILHKNGREVPFPYTKFDANQISHDGLILVYSLGVPTLYGYIDKNAKVVVPEKYIHANPFSEGLASVAIKDKDGNTKWGFIDRTGAVVIPFQFSNEPLPFSNGLALIKPLKMPDFDYAFINKKGEIKLKLKVPGSNANSFAGQYKRDVTDITIGSFNGTVAGWWSKHDPGTIPTVLTFLNINGRTHNMDSALLSRGYVLKNVQSKIKDDKLVLSTDRGFGLFNTKGDVIIPPVFSKLTLFDNESHLAYAEKIGDNNQVTKGYINESGIFVIIMTAKSGW